MTDDRKRPNGRLLLSRPPFARLVQIWSLVLCVFEPFVPAGMDDEAEEMMRKKEVPPWSSRRPVPEITLRAIAEILELAKLVHRELPSAHIEFMARQAMQVFTTTTTESIVTRVLGEDEARVCRDILEALCQDRAPPMGVSRLHSLRALPDLSAHRVPDIGKTVTSILMLWEKRPRLWVPWNMEVAGLSIDYLRRAWSHLNIGYDPSTGDPVNMDETVVMQWVCSATCLAWRFDCSPWRSDVMMSHMCLRPFAERSQHLKSMDNMLSKVLLPIMNKGDGKSEQWINRPHSFRFLLIYHPLLPDDMWPSCVYITTVAVFNPLTATWLPSHTTLASCILGTSLHGRMPPPPLVAKTKTVLGDEARHYIVNLRDVLAHERPDFNVLGETFGAVHKLTPAELEKSWKRVEEWF